MAELRFSALKEVFNREPVEKETPSKSISKYFGENVFDLHKMEHYLSKEKIIYVLINPEFEYVLNPLNNFVILCEHV